MIRGAMLRIASYNVLADAYVRREFYPRTPEAVLEPSRRRRALLEKLGDADVLCLQEVEPDAFSVFAARLSGHEARYAAKTGKPDGVATFVRRGLGAVEWRELGFADGTGHVALAAVVGGWGIANTHLKWDGEGRHARGELAEILEAWVRGGPWVVCGDFNATPESAALAFAGGRGLVDPGGGFTCNSNGRRKRIDYLLHTPELRATMMPVPEIGDLTPLPSETEPSDHLRIEGAFAPAP
jgi:endonuclease/exonuclease/phosphatase family metal-dependent hydrolase